MLKSLTALLEPMPNWAENAATQAEVKVLILDSLWEQLPQPSFSDDEAQQLAGRVYDYVWSKGRAGGLGAGSAAH